MDRAQLTGMRAALALAVLLISPPSMAAGIAFNPDHKAIYIVGVIEHEDRDRFEDIYVAHPETEAVYITSFGGDFVTGLDLAAKVRAYGLVTYSGSKCDSACGYVWLAGVRRFASGDVRMHAPFYRTNGNKILNPDMMPDIEYEIAQWPEMISGIAKVFTTGDNALFSILDGYGVSYETFDRTDWMDFSIALRDGLL